jgi:antitoxin Phd
MTKQFSVAEARNQLPRILHEVEEGNSVEITRRGKPIAVIMATAEYERLTGTPRDLWEALQEWRKTVDWDMLGDVDEVWADVRDCSPGRDFQW